MFECLEGRRYVFGVYPYVDRIEEDEQVEQRVRERLHSKTHCSVQ